jgi:hypothetical protein
MSELTFPNRQCESTREVKISRTRSTNSRLTCCPQQSKRHPPMLHKEDFDSVARRELFLTNVATFEQAGVTPIPTVRPAESSRVGCSCFLNSNSHAHLSSGNVTASSKCSLVDETIKPNSIFVLNREKFV